MVLERAFPIIILDYNLLNIHLPREIKNSSEAKIKSDKCFPPYCKAQNMAESRFTNMQLQKIFSSQCFQKYNFASLNRHLFYSRCGFGPWSRKIPWRRKWQPTPGFLPGKCHVQRSLVGYSPWGRKGVRHTWETEHHQQHWWREQGNVFLPLSEISVFLRIRLVPTPPLAGYRLNIAFKDLN